LRIGCTALIAGLLLLGCSNKNKTTSDPTNSSGPTNTVPQNDSPGRNIFNAQNCTKCHSIGGGGGPGPQKKDLAMVGKDPNHTTAWISDHIRNAKNHNQMSRMPPFGEDKLSAADLKVLSEYLASLK